MNNLEKNNGSIINEELYNEIHTELCLWPNWKKKAYNEDFAISKHSKKLEIENNNDIELD